MSKFKSPVFEKKPTTINNYTATGALEIKKNKRKQQKSSTILKCKNIYISKAPKIGMMSNLVMLLPIKILLLIFDC